MEGWKKMFYLTKHSIYLCLRLYDVGDTINEHSNSEKETFCRHYMGYSFWLAARNLLYPPTHIQDSTVRERARSHHYMGYSFWLAARYIIYTPTHRQDSTYHTLHYAKRGALARTRNSSMGPSWKIKPTTHRTMSGRSTTELHLAPSKTNQNNGFYFNQKHIISST